MYIWTVKLIRRLFFIYEVHDIIFIVKKLKIKTLLFLFTVNVFRNILIK
jgi:hypothetical protein